VHPKTYPKNITLFCIKQQGRKYILEDIVDTLRALKKHDELIYYYVLILYILHDQWLIYIALCSTAHYILSKSKN
jgi:hypothetical protein